MLRKLATRKHALPFRILLSIAAALVVGFLLIGATTSYCDLRLPETYHPALGVTCAVPENISRSEMARIAAADPSLERSPPERLVAVRDEVAADRPPVSAYVSIHTEGGFRRAHSILTAAKDAGGRWRVMFRDRSGIGARSADIALTDNQAGQLQERLRSPCLNSEPAVVSPAALGITCFDGPMTITDFSFEGRRRTIAQDCIRIGAADQLNRFLYGLLPRDPPKNLPTIVQGKQSGFILHGKPRLCRTLRRWFGLVSPS